MAVAIAVTAGSTANDIEDVNGEFQSQNDTDERIELVKNGYMEILPDIAYKDAFEYFYAAPTWRYFDAENGSPVIEFAGKCRSGFRYSLEKAEENNATAYIQFALYDSDGEGEDDTFDVTGISIKEDEELVDIDDAVRLEFLFMLFIEYSEEEPGTPLSDEVLQAFSEACELL